MELDFVLHKADIYVEQFFYSSKSTHVIFVLCKNSLFYLNRTFPWAYVGNLFFCHLNFWVHPHPSTHKGEVY